MVNDLIFALLSNTTFSGAKLSYELNKVILLPSIDCIGATKSAVTGVLLTIVVDSVSWIVGLSTHKIPYGQ